MNWVASVVAGSVSTVLVGVPASIVFSVLGVSIGSL
jgi:hypothetical protein